MQQAGAGEEENGIPAVLQPLLKPVPVQHSENAANGTTTANSTVRPQ